MAQKPSFSDSLRGNRTAAASATSAFWTSHPQRLHCGERDRDTVWYIYIYISVGVRGTTTTRRMQIFTRWERAYFGGHKTERVETFFRTTAPTAFMSWRKSKIRPRMRRDVADEARMDSTPVFFPPVSLKIPRLSGIRSLSFTTLAKYLLKMGLILV